MSADSCSKADQPANTPSTSNTYIPPSTEKLPILVSAGIPIRSDGKLLVLLRHMPEIPSWHHHWCFTWGKVQVSEHPAFTAAREIAEELGLAVVSSVESRGDFIIDKNVIVKVYLCYLSPTSPADPLHYDAHHCTHEWLNAADVAELGPSPLLGGRPFMRGNLPHLRYAAARILSS